MTDLDHRWVIAIDGPGAAGKSTVARKLAEQTGSLLFDTGALYRAVTLAAQRTGTPLDDEAALAQLASGLRIELRPPSVEDGRQADVLLDSEDVTWAIRTPAVDADVSEVSAHPEVRRVLLDTQRTIANGAHVVMVGRDIGTVVAPDAGFKVYLDASVEERARRRLLDLQERDPDATYQTVLEDLRRRDEYDSGRESAPLRAADDAVIVETDGRTIDEIVTELKQAVEAARAAEAAPGPQV
ncbi:MAG: (d)CMP kinase [Thermomicrobiales bacterium]